MLGALLVAGCIVCGQADGQTSALAERVSRLVVDLNAPEKARRDEAERQLLDLHPAALELLPELDDRMPAETRLRLARVRNQFEQRAARASLEARTVTLDAHQMPLADVLKTLQEQTGNRVFDFRPGFGQQAAAAMLDLKLDKAPFFQALDTILDQAGLTIYPYSGEAGIALVARSPNHRPRSQGASYAGAFRVAATEIIARRDLRDTGDDALQLQLEIAWEPRLRPIVLLQSTDEVAAVDDRGTTLQSTRQGSEIEIPVSEGSMAVESPLHFALPSRQATRIARLKGRFSVLLPGREETFRFEKLAPGAKGEARKAGVTVALEDVRRNNLVWEVRLRIIFDEASGALESHRGWVFNNPAELVTPDGQSVSYAGLETTRQTPTEVGVAYLFTLDGDIAGHTLVYKTPGVVMKVPLEYELTDLALP